MLRRSHATLWGGRWVRGQGDDPPGCRHGIGSDVIFAERRGQSQKPEEIYELIEELVPNGMPGLSRMCV